MIKEFSFLSLVKINVTEKCTVFNVSEISARPSLCSYTELRYIKGHELARISWTV
jgi:hypothetical protein